MDPIKVLIRETVRYKIAIQLDDVDRREFEQGLTRYVASWLKSKHANLEPQVTKLAFDTTLPMNGVAEELDQQLTDVVASWLKYYQLEGRLSTFKG